MTGLHLMTGLLSAAEGAEEESESTIQIGHHVERTWMGMTFNIDTIISTLVRRRPGADPRLLGRRAR